MLLSKWINAYGVGYFSCTEQQFFEKVDQLQRCRAELLSQAQEHLKVKEDFTKLGKTSFALLLFSYLGFAFFESYRSTYC